MTLQARIQSALSTAKQWDDDPSLLTEIRASIPMKELVPECVLRLEEDWKEFLASHDSDVGTAPATAAAAAASDADKPIKETKSKYQRPDDGNFEGDDLLLKRLTRYFKEDVMTWVNRPPCVNPNCKGNEDGKQMESQGTRGPVTAEEKAGRASRVEVYKCKLCETETTFPRYNSPRTLFQTRRGRCGEFANLFGTYCRALGFDTRYILDFTDHVWIEVWSHRTRRWICADSCEGVIDEPGMYEKGWGKKLNYAIGATKDSVVDVTRRYTRKFHEDEFQARRREFAPDEASSENVFRLANQTIRQQQSGKIPKGRLEELDARMKMEADFFVKVASSGVWDSDYKEGRISGSLAWKAARNELGEVHSLNEETIKSGDGNEAKASEEDNKSESFLVESFYPSSRHDNLIITVRPPSDEILATSPRECITVSGVPCAATVSNGISIVVVDEASGCILQSRAYLNWPGAGTFLATVPPGRIIAISSNLPGKKSGEATYDIFGAIGGLNLVIAASESSVSENSVKECVSPLFTLFVGQIGYHPKWATCIQTCNESEFIQISIELNLSSPPKVMLRSELNIVPALVSGRLPEQNMPLKTQMEATNHQKRLAFNAYMENQTSSAKSSVVGYTTKPGAPIYLIRNDAFPFRLADGVYSTESENDSWVTYHFLPEALVPDDDIILSEPPVSTKKSTIPKFDIPIDDFYFRGLLGDRLLIKDANNTPTLVNVSDALSNTRLIALYFSAHWCGPCRGFTPMLIEFYEYLKNEVAPTHGLELIFVSSDRDEAQFHQYYQKMPFAAIPFSDRQLAQRIKSQFAVQGIPSLVVIDSLSGRIVVSQDESRRLIHQACQMGERAIERLFLSWLENVPVESRSMIEILELSCAEAENNAKKASKSNSIMNSKAESYLRRLDERHEDGKHTPTSQELFAARVKKNFTKLVAEGAEPNTAGAQAIRQATVECKHSPANALDEGWVLGTHQNHSQDVTNFVKIASEEMYTLHSSDKSIVLGVLVVAKKYVANVQKDPSNPRFRTFRLGNKVFDQITSKLGGVNLLTSLGFSFFHSVIDFMASIPLSIDLELVSKVFEKIIEIYTD